MYTCEGVGAVCSQDTDIYVLQTVLLRVFGRMNYKVKCFCLKVAFLNGCKDSYK